MLDESVGGEETAGLHRPVLRVGSWSEGGREGGNFLGSDVRLNPDGGGGGEGNQRLLRRPLASITAAFGLTTAEQVDGRGHLLASGTTC